MASDCFGFSIIRGSLHEHRDSQHEQVLAYGMRIRATLFSQLCKFLREMASLFRVACLAITEGNQ
jgi:hypothetical protein